MRDAAEASSAEAPAGGAAGAEALSAQEQAAELDRDGFRVGSPGLAARDRVIRADLSEAALQQHTAEDGVWGQEAGAVVGFSGIVRNHDDGRSVERLSYTAHPQAADRLREVAQGIAGQYPGVRVWVSHRVGALEVGDHALVAAIAAAHRAEAFAACAELIEQVKAEVPIWKEQFFSDGTREWVGL